MERQITLNVDEAEYVTCLLRQALGKVLSAEQQLTLQEGKFKLAGRLYQRLFVELVRPVIGDE